MTEVGQRKRSRAKAVPQEARIDGILHAALRVFAEKGFADARMDEVAARAGVAKGTIYLHFASKEDLFKALLRNTTALPLAYAESLLLTTDLPTEALVRSLLGYIRREILETEKKYSVQLVLTEGHRFPELAQYYHDSVIAHVLPLVRRILERGRARGEVSSDALVRFPHLIVAPFVFAILWDGLFGAIEPLDIDGLFEAHLEVLGRVLPGEAE